MGLFGKKKKNRPTKQRYIPISEKQYEELYAFYEKLGLSEEQCRALSDQCFGFEVIVEKEAQYVDDWELPVRSVRSYMSEASARGRMMGAPGAAMGRAMPMMKMAVSDACMPMAEACPPMMGMPAVEMMEECREPEPEFNSAETHHAEEIENATPLDRPQIIFSANVNTASWAYVRNRVMLGNRVEPDFVRVEEIINSYPYKLKKPKDGSLFRVSTQMGPCPWDPESELLMVGIKGKKADKGVAQNLALLVDVSGSMEDRWVLVQMSVMAIISKMGKGDHVSIIAYSDNTTTVVENLECSDMDKCVKAVLSIEGIGGCTRGSEGMENAYRFLQANFDPEGNNRVFVFTDGDFNFGVTSEGGLSEMIRKKRETGIYLSIVGFGQSNFKDNKMEAMAQNGNGNYTFVASPGDILDFLSVDGIGSKHNVVAMIQLKRGKAQQQYQTRYVTPQTGGPADELAFIEIHYKTPEGENCEYTQPITLGDLEKEPDLNFQIAVLLAAFGLYVKDSDYKGKLDQAMLKDLLEKVTAASEGGMKEKYGHLEILRAALKR